MIPTKKVDMRIEDVLSFVISDERGEGYVYGVGDGHTFEEWWRDPLEAGTLEYLFFQTPDGSVWLSVGEKNDELYWGVIYLVDFENKRLVVRG